MCYHVVACYFIAAEFDAHICFFQADAQRLAEEVAREKQEAVARAKQAEEEMAAEAARKHEDARVAAAAAAEAEDRELQEMRVRRGEGDKQQ